MNRSSAPISNQPAHRWQLRGEHPIFGLAVVAANAAAATAAIYAWHNSGSRFWLAVAFALIAFALDRGVGLLAFASRSARMALRERGKYWTWRRPIQALGSIYVVLVAAAAVHFGLVSDAGRTSRRIAWIAAVALAAFVVLRSLSLHEFDGLLYRRRRLLPRLPLSFALELTASLVVMVCAFFDTR
jgi:hypothetical protein